MIKSTDIIGMSTAVAILLLIVTLLANEAFAYEVPKDAVIKVFDRNGKQIGEMSRKYYKVVRINNSVDRIKLVDDYKRNKTKSKLVKTIILHGGGGYNGLKTRHNAGVNYRVSDKIAPVFGLTGCLTRDNKGICGSAHTNRTFQLGLKLDFD